MKKRIISWMLLLGMVLSMLPATAFATDEDQMMETGSETVPIEPTEGDTTVTVNALTVGGVDALAQNTGDGWYFDPAANTLHLTGAYYDGEAEAAIYAEGDLTIVVAEGTENTFNGVDNGILTMGNLTITGSGKLRATASVAYNSGGAYGAIAIAATEKLCIFGANVTADADMVGIGSTGTMEIVDSTVEALGARNGLYSSGDLRISGSTVEAHATSVQADNKWDFRGYFLMGICAQEGDLLIENGAAVNASADQFGLYAENTTIQNSDLCVTATLTAIGTAMKLAIKGESNVQLHATLTEEQHEEYGDQATAFFCNEVEIDENLTIVGGVIGDSLVQGGAKSIVDSEGKDVAKVSIVPAIISGTCGENLTWTLDDEGTLTISGEGAMYHYHYNNATAPWTDYQDQILTVVIEAGVTSIGDCAFYECENLTSIEIPASVTSMGNYVFYGCSNLKSIDIPAGVTSIGDYAFHGCRSLTSIAIPAGITSIAAGMVSNCSSLTSLDIPAGVTHIGNAAFRDCSSLTSIEIPAGVTAIGSNAFYSCVSLKTVTFKGNAPVIASNAFLGTTTTAYYPADNTTWTEEVKQNYGGTITWEAYDNGNSGEVASGTCGDNLTWMLDADGTLTISGEGAMYNYDYNNATTPWNDYQDQILSAVVEDGVTSIGNNAFDGCSSLTIIDLPASVTSIGDYAFYECTNLTSVAIPASVTFIGDAAFCGCSGLTSIDLPASLTSIGHSAFWNCSSLTSIDLPAGVTSIDSSAFAYCSSLTSITIPEGVTSIGFDTFAYCSSLISIDIPAGVTTIGEYAFHGCSNLTSIDLPASVTSIDNGAFYDCTSLTSIDLPAGMTYIGEYAFYGCSSLTSIDIPAGVTSINPGMFFTCSSLTSIVLPAGVTFIGDNAFADCSSLTSIDIPAGVKVIGNYIFAGCSNLTSIELPEGVIYIGYAAFRDCSSLISIHIPADVTFIGDDAFSGCAGLKTVTFKGNAPSIGYDAFLGTTTTAYYPAGDTTWTEEVKQNYGGSITWIAVTSVSFGDVEPGAFYEIPVQWAVENGITSGVDENHFAPDAPCTRAQIVTFLWRAAGSPKPASKSSSFVDVSADSYYYQAVIWAVENGITSGNDATHFAPDAPCNRAQVVTFLWRFRGRPDSSGGNVFTDVTPGAYYYDAVLWAVEKGISNGMGDGNFGADVVCSRGQIVTFLYRTLA